MLGTTGTGGDGCWVDIAIGGVWEYGGGDDTGFGLGGVGDGGRTAAGTGGGDGTGADGDNAVGGAASVGEDSGDGGGGLRMAGAGGVPYVGDWVGDGTGVTPKGGLGLQRAGEMEGKGFQLLEVRWKEAQSTLVVQWVAVSRRQAAEEMVRSKLCLGTAGLGSRERVATRGGEGRRLWGLWWW